MRKFAAVALAAAILFSTAGCSFTRDVETTKMYAPSDGAQVDLANGIKARNFIYLTNGVTSSLIGSIVNDGLTAASATLQFKDVEGVKHNETYKVAAGAKLDIGYDGTTWMNVSIENQQGTVALPGQIVTVYVTSGKQTGRGLEVPVLNGDHKGYTALFDALPKTLETETPTPEATPAPTN